DRILRDDLHSENQLSKKGDVMRYGYARVSSDTQDYSAQIEALKAAGCERIYSEKASGKSTNGRPELAKLLKALDPGDVMLVTKIDRVARSALDLLHIIRTEIAGRHAVLSRLATAGATPQTRWAASCSPSCLALPSLSAT